MEGKIELSVEKDGIMIKTHKSVPHREQWEKLFSKAIASGEKPGSDVFNGMENEADKSEWAW